MVDESEKKHFIKAYDFLKDVKVLAFIDEQSCRLPEIGRVGKEEQFRKLKQFFQSVNKLSITFDKYARITEENVSSLTYVFSQLHQIENICLTFSSSNCCEPFFYQGLFQSFADMLFLKGLTINVDSNHSINEDSVILLGQSISNLQSLTLLSINVNFKNIIGLQGATSLSEGISNLTNIKILNLYFGKETNIGSEGFIKIGSAISKLTKLDHLQLEINCTKIDINGMVGFRNQIRYLENIKTLTINMSQPEHIFLISLLHDFDLKYDTFLINSCYNVSFANKSNQSLSFAVNHVEDGKLACQGLDQAFRVFFDLKSLRLQLAENNIGTEGVMILAKGISFMKQLNYLNLNLEINNINSAEGLAKILESCAQSKQLTELYLSVENNKISESRFEEVGTNLKELKSLRVLKLNFNNNRISSHGCIILGTSIGSLKELQILDLSLSKNNITTSGVIGLSQGLQQLYQLRYLTLSLDSNDVNGMGIMSIGRALEDKITMRSLNLDFNSNKGYISYESVEYLATVLKKLIACYFLKINLISPYSSLLISIIDSLQYQNSNFIKFNFLKSCKFSVKNNYRNYFQKSGINLQICYQRDEMSELKYIIYPLSQITNLTQLNLNLLQYNNFNTETASKLGQSLQELVNLEELTLKFQVNSTLNDEGILDLFVGMRDLKELITLKLEINQGKDIQITNGISQGLSQLQNIQKLDITITTEETKQLVIQQDVGRGINQMLSLRELIINVQRIQSSYRSSLCTYEVINEVKDWSKLRLLHLHLYEDNCLLLANRFHSIISLESLKLIFTVQQAKQITWFQKDGSDIRKEKEDNLIKLFSSLKNIKEFHFENPYSDAAAFVGQSLPSMTSLVRFALVNFDLKFDKGISNLLFQNLRQLTHLYLSLANFKLGFIANIFEHLAQLNNLEFLEINRSGNNFEYYFEFSALRRAYSNFSNSVQFLQVLRLSRFFLQIERLKRSFKKQKRLVVLKQLS